MYDSDDELQMGRGHEETQVAKSSWEVLRDSGELVAKTLENEEAVRQLRREAPVGKEALQEALTMHRCSCCSSFSIKQLEGAEGTRTVCWVGSSGAALLKVSIWECLDCASVFHAHPAAIGGFPSTPVRALNLYRSYSDKAVPIWLDTLLLSSIVCLQHESAATSEAGICSAVCAAAEKASGGLLPLDKKRLHCLLGPAIEEYLVVISKIADIAELGVLDYPVNKERLLSCCAACWLAGTRDPVTGARRSLHSLYMDGCMKIRHMAFSPTGDSTALQQRIVTTEDRSNSSPALFSRAPSVRGSKSWCSSVAADMKGVPDSEFRQCGAEFVSGRATSGKSAKVDVSGIFGGLCRHRFFIAGASMAFGERYAFGCMLLYLITAQNGTNIDFCWYDIGPCKFKVTHHVRFNVMQNT